MKAFVWKLKNGAIVHPECREPYYATLPKGTNHIGIDSAIHADDATGELPPSHMFPEGRFTLCAHCKQSVMEHLAAIEKGQQ